MAFLQTYLLLCQRMFPFLRRRNQVRIHLQQYSHEFSEEARELWKKNPFTLKWFTLFTRKKKVRKPERNSLFFSYCACLSTAVTQLCCTFIKSFTSWQSSNFFKFIQESMQNNYQFSFKTRMTFFLMISVPVIFICLLFAL